MSLPGSAAPPATDRRRDGFARAFGRGRRRAAALGHHRTRHPDQRGVRERHRCRHGFRRLDQRRAAPAGHRPRGATCDLDIDDFARIGARVPHLADVKPFGEYVMTDIDRVGGVPVVMKALLDAGLLHGDCLTVTGKTAGREPRRTSTRPTRRQGRAGAGRADPPHRRHHHPQGLARARGGRREVGRLRRRRLRGHAPGSSTASGPPWTPSSDGTLRPGDVVVIRYEGPKGGPGMREMLAVTGRDQGRRPGQGRAAAHRRPVLRRHHRPVRRPRRARGGRRRPDRLRPGRRPHHLGRRGRSPGSRRQSRRACSARRGVHPAAAQVPNRRPRQVPPPGGQREPRAPSATESSARGSVCVVKPGS